MTYEKNPRLSSCPHCGQRMPLMRLGVRLYPMTCRIFDLIERSGRDGIAGRDLYRVAYAGIRKPTYNTVKGHIGHIREALLNTEYRILCEGGKHPIYRLVKVVKLQAFESVSSHAR